MADLLTTPQFSYPFRVVGGQVACLEQDTDEEIFQNAITVLRYHPGDRQGLPSFGIPDPVFSEGGADLNEIARRVRKWEPSIEVEDLQQLVGQDGQHIIEITFRGRSGEFF